MGLPVFHDNELLIAEKLNEAFAEAYGWFPVDLNIVPALLNYFDTAGGQTALDQALSKALTDGMVTKEKLDKIVASLVAAALPFIFADIVKNNPALLAGPLTEILNGKEAYALHHAIHEGIFAYKGTRDNLWLRWIGKLLDPAATPHPERSRIVLSLGGQLGAKGLKYDEPGLIDGVREGLINTLRFGKADFGENTVPAEKVVDAFAEVLSCKNNAKTPKFFNALIEEALNKQQWTDPKFKHRLQQLVCEPVFNHNADWAAVANLWVSLLGRLADDKLTGEKEKVEDCAAARLFFVPFFASDKNKKIFHQASGIEALMTEMKNLTSALTALTERVKVLESKIK